LGLPASIILHVTSPFILRSKRLLLLFMPGCSLKPDEGPATVKSVNVDLLTA